MEYDETRYYEKKAFFLEQLRNLINTEIDRDHDEDIDAFLNAMEDISSSDW